MADDSILCDDSKLRCRSYKNTLLGLSKGVNRGDVNQICFLGDKCQFVCSLSAYGSKQRTQVTKYKSKKHFKL